ncbi:MAG: hypothetical protein CEN88_223, partial [Candidatus Berkelbacteria bacterium Licking1014_2]
MVKALGLGPRDSRFESAVPDQSRQVKGLSQDRLSKVADVSYNSIIKLETGG